MVKKVKQTRTEQKVRGKVAKAAVKSSSSKQCGSVKKLAKKHQDYLRGLEKRKQELIIANRATHNKHVAELEALEKQIEEWKARIAAELNKE